MHPHKTIKIGLLILAFLMTCSGLVCPAEQGKKPLTFQDIMKFRAIADPVISEDGSWVAYTARPDRGDGDVRIQGTKAETSFTIERGSKPVFSKDSCWLAAVINPKAVDLEKAGKEKPRPGLSVLDLATGRLISFDKIEKFSFSPDSSWLACHLFKEEEKKEEKPKEEEKADKEAPRPKMKETGSLFILRHLESEKETRIPHVLSYAFDEQGRYLAYAMAEPEGLKNGVFCLDLKKEGSPALTALAQEKMMYGQLTWEKDGNALAFLAATADEKGNKGGASLWIWTAKTGKSRAADSADSLSSGWVIPSKNKLNWSKDGKRVFFGLQPDEIFKLQSGLEEETQKTEEIDLFDLDRILEKREVDVWHWNDPRIIPHQKKQWPRVKEKTHLAVFHVDSGKMVPLADREVHEVEIPENPRLALGFSDVPYLKEMTWNGIYTDVYHIDLATGRKTKILSRQRFTPTLSPSGNYVLYFREGHWHLYDIGRGASRNLTAALPWPFFDEENDVPGEAPPYGFDGWLEDESGLLLYDRYDIWKVSTRREEALNLTDGKGRKAGLTFRILRLDPEQKFLKKDESLLLSAYHNLTKHSGFYAASVARPGVEKRLEENKKFAFLAMAKNADVILFTRESYAEFPDIWVSGTDFKAPLRLTDVNPQIRDFAWGSAEQVEWMSLDGVPLRGVLVRPGNYEPGKRYPVLVYFYEKFSQRLYEFNQIVVNHRPCFPFYASHGYAIFLPDIVYETGRPGLSATKCLVPGVQKLIDMGIADPKAIALHGHSWSGYQTAFVVTQTNIFRAAIAGAAVGNMTSAYSGIRWESGLARQWQYEKAQSRIGGSLWDRLEPYIENSPVFFADRIQTPLLLMFGDEDGAVPWEQGIELYLAMRRLGKDCVFLQYRGEPHHPQKYANKLDYAIRMKEYLDHHLKGSPAPDWIRKGVPYLGK